MGVKCCVCLKDKKHPDPSLNKKEAPTEEKNTILNPNEINPTISSKKPHYNPQSSLQVEQFKSQLLEALIKANLEDISEVFNRGFPVMEPVNNEKFTTLHIACKVGNVIVVSHLIEEISGMINIIDIQDENEKWTPLMLASMNGHLEIVKFLLHNKAKKNILSEENKTAEEYARLGGFKEIEKILQKD